MAQPTSNDPFIVLMNNMFHPPTHFSKLNIQIGPPTPIANATGRLNTQMTVLGYPGRGYKGQVLLRYHRLTLTEVITQTVFRSRTGFTQEGLLTSINNLFRAQLTQEHLEPFTVPTLTEGQTATVTLRARAESPVWVGSIQLTLEHNRPHLNTAVGARLLPLFVHQADPLKGRSARMLTWGIDFSSIKEAIVPNFRGEYSNWAALQEACAQLNIPGWTNGPITDRPTSEVADANQAFARVVIQPNVISAGMTGSLYFHYNP